MTSPGGALAVAHMKARGVLFPSSALAALLACLAVAAVSAEPGTAGASFLRFSPSPRATGMGESHTAVSADAYSVYWNPAGLAALEVPELGAMHNSSFEDVASQYLAVAYPLEYGSTLGLGISRLSVGAYPTYDSIGVKTGTAESSGLSIAAVYGRALFKDEISRPVLSAGGGLKYISSSLAGVPARTFAADMGAVYSLRPANYWLRKIPAQELRLGLVLRNLGPGLKYDREVTPLPAEAAVGAAWISHPRGESRLILSLDNVLRSGDGYFAALGAEYTAYKLLSFRAGFRTGQDAGSGIRAGVGFHFPPLELDYSMSPFGDLGNMHKFSLSAKFGAPKAAAPLEGEISRTAKGKLAAAEESIEKLRDYSEDLLALAGRDMAANRFVSALASVNKAFNLQPKLVDGPWGGRRERLALVVKGLSFAENPAAEQLFYGGTLQAKTAAEAVREFVGGAELKSFLLAHAAYGENLRGDAVFEKLLKLLGRATGQQIRSDEILPRAALIQKKLNDSFEMFSRKEFQAAARECEEVLLLDQGLVLAWKRLGSCYFALNDMEQSKRAYKKVLEITPDDPSVLKFMRSKGWE